MQPYLDRYVKVKTVTFEGQGLQGIKLKVCLLFHFNYCVAEFCSIVQDVLTDSMPDLDI